MADWFTEYEPGSFPIDRVALGDCDLSVLRIGDEWQWLVRSDGRDVAEGAARADLEAREQAEASASLRAEQCGSG